MAIKRTASALTAAALVALLAACGSSSDTTGTAASGGSSTDAASLGSCGKLPDRAPKDPDGVLASLPASTKEAFNGYSSPVRASRWSKWKPKSDKATVAISWTQPVNDFAAQALATLRADLEKDPHVGQVTVVDGAASGDIPGQLQQFQSLVQRKPDLMIVNVSAGEPFLEPIAAAAKQGIPTISVLTSVDSADAVTVVPNAYLAAAQTMSALVKQLDGKGSLLEVHGIPSLSIDKEAFDGFAAVLAKCPDVDVVGEVTGNFAPAQAKAAVLKFVSTHPQPVDAVSASGGMATGIISAFQQAGRDVPAVSEEAALKGTLGYWRQHKDSFKGASSGGAGVETAHMFSGVASRMLAGHGIKVNAVSVEQPIITPENLDEWAESDWSLETPGTAPGPPDYLKVDRFLAPLFNSSAG